MRTLQWTSTRVVTLTEDVHTTFGSLRCSWSPPLVTMRFPLATASRWLGKSSCDGRLDMDASTTVEGITTVLEAGRSWTAVVLRSDRTSSGGGTESHGVITTWFSPELGQTVRWQSTMSGGTETGHLDRVLTR